MPIILTLVIEKGLSLRVINSSLGMAAHVTNIIVLVLIPMIVIHVKGDTFSLGMVT